MKIVVLSCDNNEEIFDAFHHCIEKYWPDHPEVIYFTESLQNPYYKTISIPHTMSHWVPAAREMLTKIEDNQILMMVDDIFIRDYVDTERLQYASEHLTGNIALFNLEKSWDINDENVGLVGFKRRKHGSPYEISMMCGLWDKEKLLDVLSIDGSIWDVEYKQNTCGYDYYINSGDYIINWGHTYATPFAIFKGKWCREIIPFFEKEGLTVDYNKKGFFD